MPDSPSLATAAYVAFNGVSVISSYVFALVAVAYWYLCLSTKSGKPEPSGSLGIVVGALTLGFNFWLVMVSYMHGTGTFASMLHAAMAVLGIATIIAGAFTLADNINRKVTAQVREGADWVRQIESLDGCGIARAVKA